MKKYLLIVGVVAMGLSFAACSGNKGESAKASDETKQEEVVATPPSDDDLLTNYEALVNKVIELQGKIASGDTASATELTKVNGDVATLVTQLQNELPNFTPEQTQKWTELVQKLADAQKTAKP